GKKSRNQKQSETSHENFLTGRRDNAPHLRLRSKAPSDFSFLTFTLTPGPPGLAFLCLLTKQKSRSQAVMAETAAWLFAVRSSCRAADRAAATAAGEAMFTWKAPSTSTPC